MSQAAPFGAFGRPLIYSKVVSSGAIRPARAPPSIDMLQTVMRPSIERPRIASPAYSMTWPVPPAVPISPMMARMMSLAPTPGGGLPSTVIRMFLAFFWISVWVASTCSTSEVPMPWASAPKAPWVEVWLSPQTMVMPGSVKPCSGPMMWTMPWRLVELVEVLDAEILGVPGERRDLDRRFRIVDAVAAIGGRHVVVDDGERLLRRADLACRPAAGPRRPAGWSPRGRDGGRYRGAQVPSLSSWTTWSSQILS